MKVTIQQALKQCYTNNQSESKIALPQDEELKAYIYIQDGNVEMACQEGKKMFSKTKPIIQGNYMAGMQYAFIVSASLSALYARNGGLEYKETCKIRDIFLTQCNLVFDAEQLSELHDRMMRAFSERVKEVKKDSVATLPVRQAIKYIQNHLDEPLRLSELSKQAKLTPNYLSSLFSKEMGMTIRQYIKLQRIDAAKKLLKNYDFSISEIARALNFSSESHFIKSFREETGNTPAQYRKS